MRRRDLAVDRRLGATPGFWVASSAIFTLDALLAAARSDWVVAGLQASTSVLASVAAVAEANRDRLAAADRPTR